MPDVLFCHNGWNFIDHPPYAGEWWAVTRHRTVEMVTVDLKDPDHLGKADPFLTATPDPYIYVFGQAGGKLVETIATRRWTHWMPVLPPEPPLDFDPVASGLADPSPGPRLATFRLDPGHGAPAGPHRTVEHELERRAKPLDEIGLDWRAVAARRRQEGTARPACGPSSTRSWSSSTARTPRPTSRWTCRPGRARAAPRPRPPT